METIRDMSWMRQLLYGKVLEKFSFGSFSVVSLELEHEKHGFKDPYRYRILFFPKNDSKPVLAMNMESTILGTHNLTEHAGNNHRNFGPVEESFGYQDFKSWALERAQEEITD
ncbi:MAG: hypothetical protein JW760_01080 [Spirochaetales bacterium]|nr:hypothetical protein [Spirochaetales bacterium]